jgi:hypothetical protein
MSPMHTYYFDFKDGVPIRDRVGLAFRTDSQAIEHSKEIARRLRHEQPAREDNLCIVVLKESGTEVHREPVYPAPV